MEYRQRDWPEWLVIAEFAVNNKVYSATKFSHFMANYRRELRMRSDISRKGKVEKATEFAERIKKIQEETGAVLRKVQEDIKRQVDKGQQEVENWKKGDKIILSMKDLVFKERLVKKLTERYIKPYKIEEVVLRNAVKLKLLASMRIYLIVNVSRIKRYREPMRGQRVEKLKPVKVDRVEE